MVIDIDNNATTDGKFYATGPTCRPKVNYKIWSHAHHKFDPI